MKLPQVINKECDGRFSPIQGKPPNSILPKHNSLRQPLNENHGTLIYRNNCCNTPVTKSLPYCYGTLCQWPYKHLARCFRIRQGLFCWLTALALGRVQYETIPYPPSTVGARVTYPQTSPLTCKHTHTTQTTPKHRKRADHDKYCNSV